MPEALHLAWRAGLGGAAAFALAAGAMAQMEPVDYEVRARIEANGPTWRLPIEVPRVLESRLRGVVRAATSTRSVPVRLEVEAGLDEKYHRLPSFDVRFVSEDPDGLRSLASRTLTTLLAPHEELYRRRIRIFEHQMKVLDDYVRGHPERTEKELVNVRRLQDQARKVLDSGPSRVTVGPTAPRPRGRGLVVPGLGGALLGFLLGFSGALFWRLGPTWSDDIGRTIARTVTTRGGWIAASTAFGVLAGWLLGAALPRERTVHGVVQPAALGPSRPVTRPFKLAHVMQRELSAEMPAGGELTVRSVRDLSPYRTQVNLVRVAVGGLPEAQAREWVHRAFDRIAARQDPGLPALRRADEARLDVLAKSIDGIGDPNDLVRAATEQAALRERASPALGHETRMLGPPWVTSDDGQRTRLLQAIGGGLAFLLSSALLVLIGRRR